MIGAQCFTTKASIDYAVETGRLEDESKFTIAGHFKDYIDEGTWCLLWLKDEAVTFSVKEPLLYDTCTDFDKIGYPPAPNSSIIVNVQLNVRDFSYTRPEWLLHAFSSLILPVMDPSPHTPTP
jgi:hypothetical protein